MNNSSRYDCAIIGGGVAGLSLSILLAKSGYRVAVIEKHRFPFHKVCGEYVSNESFDFFSRLGLPLNEWNLPLINQLVITSYKGFELRSPLGLGGFGISRFRLDNELFGLAKKNGVTVFEDTRVTGINENTVVTNRSGITAKLIFGAFGKVSPAFAKDKPENMRDNYLGVKYHVHASWPGNLIGLHHFSKGYCGISRIEDNKYCLCYLSHSSNLKDAGNSISAMEEKFIKVNPVLRKLFNESEFILREPVTISNIRFGARATSGNGMIFVGDAAGCISPLTGNGISMAARSALMLAGLTEKYFRNEISEIALRKEYARQWHARFAGRILRGKFLQYLFNDQGRAHATLRLLNPFSGIKTAIIASTHGKPF
jgi:menaquinone-9 beta-reductase